MKGVIIEKTGGVEVLQYKTDLPVPVPKEGEVLVKSDVCLACLPSFHSTPWQPFPLFTRGKEGEEGRERGNATNAHSSSA